MKNKILIYIIVLIIAVAGLGVAIYFFNKDSPETPNPTQETCVLTLKVNDDSLGRINTLSGIYYKNREVESKASAINNSTFMGWYLGDNLLSTEANYKYMVKEDSNIKAMFKARDMVTIDELEVKVNNLNLSSEYAPIQFELYRRFYKKSIKLSFSNPEILFPEIKQYLTRGIFVSNCTITCNFDVENNIIGYEIYASGYIDHNIYFVEIVDKPISEDEAIKLISNIPFKYIKEFDFIVAKYENIFIKILNLLENEYEENGSSTINIASLFGFKVDNQISVYNQTGTVIVNSENLIINSFYDVDDTIPELDEEGNFIINASSYFNLEARFSVSSTQPSYWLTFPELENTYITRRYFNNEVAYQSPSNYFEKMKEQFEEFYFPDTSLVRRVEFKYDLSTTLTKLKEIYDEALQDNLEAFNQSSLGLITNINLSNIFNFYDDDGVVVENVKFNLDLSLLKS